MQCYECAEHGVERAAVALCRSCSAELCLEHLRETAARFATDHILAACHHDTWTASKTPLRRRLHGRQRMAAVPSPPVRTARGCPPEMLTLAGGTGRRRDPHQIDLASSRPVRVSG
jgi:Uncharacterized protein conserved in archaea (DUF2180)